MLPHGGVVAEHLRASFVGTGDCPGNFIKSFLLWFYPTGWYNNNNNNNVKINIKLYLAKSANCFGSDKSKPGIPPTGIFFPVMYSV